MKALNYLRKRNYQLWLEKLVVGVEEPIFIKGGSGTDHRYDDDANPSRQASCSLHD